MLRVFRALSHVPPPLLFVVALLVGLRTSHAYPRPLVPANLARPTTSLGLVLFVAGVVLALSAIGLFIRHRTTIVPHHRSRALVTSGPFRFTRNPMYVALCCVFVGICLLTNAAWSLPFLALPVAYVHAITIPREERLLRNSFGVEYQTYAASVRRWV